MYPFLKGLRVVEAASFVAGPSCGLYLAQMGAEVVRVDMLGGGPDFRRWPQTAEGESLYWEGLNKAKKSVALDLGRPEGRTLLQRLATAPGSKAGLFVTNFPHDGFLAYDRLAALRPDLICVRVMGWPDGATALDYTVNAAVGLPLITGPVDDVRPVNHVLPAWDLLTGAYAAFALLAGVLERQTSGLGREIRIPLSDVAATALANLGMTAEIVAGGGPRERMGNDLFGAFGRDFVTSDGERIMLVAVTGRQWRGLVDVLDLTAPVALLESQLAVDFAADESARFLHRDPLFGLVDHAIRARPLAVLAGAFEAAGVCWSRYQPLAAALDDPRLFKGNPVFEPLTNVSGATYLAPGAAATASGAAREPVRPARRLGEDTREVLAEWLGLGDVELDDLSAAKII